MRASKVLHIVKGKLRLQHWRRALWAAAILAVFGGGAGVAIVTDQSNVVLVHTAAAEHITQGELNAIADQFDRFETAFEHGDDLFGTSFNSIDGGGANVGQGQRYTRIPRADLVGAGQWATHTPSRATGPNAASCAECHNVPFEDGAGAAAGNVHRDPFHLGQLNRFIERNTPAVFALGGLQLLGEEMTDDLRADRQRIRDTTCAVGSASGTLDSKGVNFGTLSATRNTAVPCTVTWNTANVQGVDTDPRDANGMPILTVRAFQWKGSVTMIRDFVRGALHNEIGIQAQEMCVDGADCDADGVANEATFGDVTSMTVYMAGQPRPTTLIELNNLGLLDPALTADQITAINRGQQVFGQIGCATCHIPSLTVNDVTFREPSPRASFRDAVMPAGQDPVARGLLPNNPATFDITKDQLDNHVPRPAAGCGTGVSETADGECNLGAFRRDPATGRAIIELFGDLKRHNMGARLQETINESSGSAADPNPAAPLNRNRADTFMTENLWGVGSTAPYMHDGRATTLAEAIIEHANPGDTVSEARGARSAYLALGVDDKKAVIAFLQNLVLFAQPSAEEAAVAARSTVSTAVAPQPRHTQKGIVPPGFKIKQPEK